MLDLGGDIFVDLRFVTHHMYNPPSEYLPT